MLPTNGALTTRRVKASVSGTEEVQLMMPNRKAQCVVGLRDTSISEKRKVNNRFTVGIGTIISMCMQLRWFRLKLKLPKHREMRQLGLVVLRIIIQRIVHSSL